MPFFSNFSDDDWEMFLKTPIIINKTPDHVIFPEEYPYVLSLETKVVLETIMANMKETSTEKEAFAFLPEKPKFGMDNCATHHVCTDINMFIGEITKITNIGIRGVGGVAAATGIGTIQFNLLNSNSESDTITLKNLIYLPECPKNLLSIHRWSKDRGDDAGIFSRGDYSIFLWDNDNSKNLIHHPPACPIPLMTVNEGDEDISISSIEKEDDLLACLFSHFPLFLNLIRIHFLTFLS